MGLGLFWFGWLHSSAERLSRSTRNPGWERRVLELIPPVGQNGESKKVH